MRNTCLRFLAALLGLVPLATYGVDAVLTDDAYVTTAKAGTNYGTQTVLNVDSKSRTYLQFHLGIIWDHGFPASSIHATSGTSVGQTTSPAVNSIGVRPRYSLTTVFLQSGAVFWS
jgi:hypothetical protein